MAIKDRTAKGYAAVKEIVNILDNVYFGENFMEALTLLRNAQLHSILLHNLEAVHGLTEKDMAQLDKVDLSLIRKALKLSTKSAKCVIMLELQLVPV